MVVIEFLDADDNGTMISLKEDGSVYFDWGRIEKTNKMIKNANLAFCDIATIISIIAMAARDQNGFSGTSINIGSVIPTLNKTPPKDYNI